MLGEKFVNYLKSGVSLIAVNTIEIDRCTKTLQELLKDWNKKVSETNASEYLKANGYDFWKWDINSGWLKVGDDAKPSSDLRQYAAPRTCLKLPLQTEISGAGVFIVENMNLLWNDCALKPVIIADLIEIASKKLPFHHVIFVGSIGQIPPEVAPLFGWIDFALPTHMELETLTHKYDNILKTPLTDRQRGEVADSAAGLTLYEADQAIKSSIVKEVGKTVNIPMIFAEKAKSVKKSGLLEYMEVDDTIENVGGLVNLKTWIRRVAESFKNRADALKYGLAAPRGTLLCGISGTGKSLIAKIIAHEFGVPLYKWDIGKLFGSLVGSTEQNTREAFKLIESVSPAVFYIDEIEKSLAGVESSNQTDSGVTARVVGAFLTFMQEKTCPAFFAATANSVSKLSPEMLRRFNGVWFVDLPSPVERKEIFEIHIKKSGRDHKKFKIAELVKMTDGFTGAEIQLAVEEGMYIAFAEKQREYTFEDVKAAIKHLPKLADTKAEDIKRLRAWAKGRARVANLAVEGEKPVWWDNTDIIIEDEVKKVG
jgi:ATP-dependent 26S proteasome regulatory subunit